MDRWWNRPLGWPFVPAVGWGIQGVLLAIAALLALDFCMNLSQGDESILRAASAEHLGLLAGIFALLSGGGGALCLALCMREWKRGC